MPVAIAASRIVQQAFRFIGLPSPSSFDDASDQATDAKELYPGAMETCLLEADWSFASTLASLPEVSNPVQSSLEPAFPYLFKMPADALVLRQVMPAGTRYRVDKAYLRATAPGPLTVRYTSTVDVETSLPQSFQIMVALQLAARLAPIHADSNTITTALEERYQLALRDALRVDAQTASPTDWRDETYPDWATEAVR